MNSISFPSYVGAIARRIFNVVSTLSISSQYYALQEEKWHIRPNQHNLPREPFGESVLEGWANGGKGDARTPPRDAFKTSILKSSTVPIPLLDRKWWPSIFSSYHQRGETSFPPPSMDPPPGLTEPPKPPRKPRVELQSPQKAIPEPPDTIHQLMMNPALVNPLRTPRYPIVLCHGLYGFDARGPTSFPSLRMHYWSNTLQILRGTIGAEVIVTSVPGTGNIASRSARLDEQLQGKARGRGVNFLAHSMGGLDCRHLITHRKPTEYSPLSLTSVSTPHRGSPFMDWCAEHIGIGKLRQHERQLLYGRSKQDDGDPFDTNPTLSSLRDADNDQSTSDANADASSKFNVTSLPSSFTTLLLSTVDSPAYANLTTEYLNDVFNPATPDDPNVKYFCVAGRAGSVGILHPFWFTKMVVDGVEEKERARLAAEWLAAGGNWSNKNSPSQTPPIWADERQWGNDGLVTVQSAKWGEFLGILDNCDHWEMRGARGLEFGVDLPAIPAIGLGSAPLMTSTGRVKATTTPDTANSSASSASKSEAWYIREWMRFAGGWKRDEKDVVSQSSGVTSTTTTTPAAASGSGSIDHSGVRQDTAANISASSASAASPSSTPTTEEERDEEKRQRQRDFTKGDQVVRSSTDRLSVVFDWLVDQMPNPQTLTGVGTLPTALFKGKGKETEAEATGSVSPSSATNDARGFAAAMASYTVGGGSSGETSSSTATSLLSPLSLSPDAKPETLATEVKKMMERERKGWKKNELARKEDLERFYVALSRKMWDEGL